MVANSDTTASASRIVGVANFKRPVVVDESAADAVLLTIEGVACHIPYTVKVVADRAEHDRILEVIDEKLHLAEIRFSIFRPDSEVSIINALGAGTPHTMSDEFAEIMEEVEQLVRVTGGLYDPACLPLLDYYKGLKEGENSDSSTVRDIAAYAQYSAFDRLCNILTKTHPAAKLDLGSIAKGWAVDKVLDGIVALGFKHCYVDWGGDIKVSGRHPSGRYWSSAIVEPPSLKHLGAEPTKQEYLMVMELKPGNALATSGDYAQVSMRGAQQFHHIMDMKTRQMMRPSEEQLAQASVVTTSCMVSDALATACLAVGDVRAGRQLMDYCRSYREPVKDYLLYARAGPRIVPMKDPAKETRGAREERLSSHVRGAHVVVVGGGLAGCCAAIEAVRAGAKVTLLEKESQLGGNSAKATSGINGWGTDTQAKQGVQDHERFFERDVFRSGLGGLCDPSLVRMLSTKSAEAIHWLKEELEVPLTVLSQLGGHSRKRTHRAPDAKDGSPVPIGWTIMMAMRNYIESVLGDSVTVVCGARVARLLWSVDSEHGNRKCVEGVVYTRDGDDTEIELRSDAVVMATGGFGCDHTSTSLLRRFRPDLESIPSTNGAFATGDGMKMCDEIGASLVDMDKVQLHPTSFVDPKDPFNQTKYLGPEALRGSGGILLTQRGKRFVNELGLRSKVSQAIIEHCEPYRTEGDGREGQPFAWCVLNEQAQELFGKAALGFYKDRLGLFETADTVDALAGIIGCDPEVLRATFEEYQKAGELGIDSVTGKTTFPAKFSPQDRRLVVARVTPSIHYTMGGVRISASAEVQETISRSVFGKRRPIRRLFAAGEVTGGVHGANRLGGNSLLECVVFGRIAGERAATVNQKRHHCLAGSDWVPVTLREMRVTDEKFGINTRVFRFNFHGALQTSGMEVGQFVGIRGDMDGETLVGFYSPITRPKDEGVIDILCRTDNKGGSIVDLLTYIRPGSAVYLKAMGGLSLKFHDGKVWHGDREIKQIGLLAGGTGIAPMIQIIRAFIRHEVIEEGRALGNSLRLIYAADTVYDLAFIGVLDDIKYRFSEFFDYHRILANPPLGWYEGVGFVTENTIKKHLFYPPSPADDQLIVICGPKIFEKLMGNMLESLGFPRHSYYFFSQDN